MYVCKQSETRKLYGLLLDEDNDFDGFHIEPG